MSGYTKGPWIDTGLFIEDSNGYAVGMAVPWVNNRAQVANARLIAAAPELLEALEWCVNHLKLIEERDYPTLEEKHRRFNSTAAGMAAIAKANGQTFSQTCSTVLSDSCSKSSELLELMSGE